MDLSRRSTQTEWMDERRASPAELAAVLADLTVVNTVTLARLPTIAFMRRVARGLPAGAALRVLDVGYGEGDMLRRIHRWGARTGVPLRLAGVDLDPASAPAAQAATPPAWGIEYRTGDVFDQPPGGQDVVGQDVVISSLFTHHLSDAQVVDFLAWMERSAARGWFVNDLHRHALAYEGFKLLSGAAGWHPMVQHDGVVSVARSFRRRDWEGLLRRAGLSGVARVRWHMPFRLCVSRIKALPRL